MKTATVRELRNNFARLAQWIEHGEKITITRNGETFATLVPAILEKRHRIDWAAHLKTHQPVGKGMSKEATEKLWSDLRD